MPRYQRMLKAYRGLYAVMVLMACCSIVSDAPIHEDTADEISLKSRVSSAAGGQRSRNPTLKVGGSGGRSSELF
jgi:hypothetical protein